jgi:hypothetical protein
MAAAIIPLVAAAVSAIGPQIPGIVQMVENLFGHSADTGKKDGPAKMQTAVTLSTAMLQQLANAGRIPSAPVVDASLPAGLAGAIQQAVDALKAQGQLTTLAPAAPEATPITLPAVFRFKGEISSQ